MAPRRQTYARSRSTSYNVLPHPPAPAPPPAPPTNHELMPPTSRYLHNLRVIQRHDPSITSIFDQFPHVCVYHHKGDEWQKKGCEGAMFLFEREQEPKYGFYILNRNNTGDFIQRMTPDDDVELASAYLIYRAFGKVTSDTIGLWTMVTQDREAMSKVMMRLHYYIKRNIRYPDEFRRSPDTWSTTPASIRGKSAPPMAPPQQSSSMSALSALLTKLDTSTSPDPAPPNPSPPSRVISASVPLPATGIPLLDAIFASAYTSQMQTPPTTNPQTSGTSSSGGNAYTTDALKAPSTTSTSSGPTPTQRTTQLPASRFPLISNTMVNGIHPIEERNVPPPISRNGTNEATRMSTTRLNGKIAVPSVIDEKGPEQHPPLNSISPKNDDMQQQSRENTGATAGVEILENGVDPHSPTRKTRKARKRERERVRRRLRRGAAPASGGGDVEGVDGRAEDHVDWPLVDDRSLSVDEDHDDGAPSASLGDGLLSALAAVGERTPPPPLGRAVGGPEAESPTSAKKARSERGKDRGKRRQKEEAPSGGPQVLDVSGDAAAAAVGHGIQPQDAHNALLDAYGRRRRVGDRILDEGTLAKEVVELIQNNPAFVKELHQMYLLRVQV